MPQKITLHHTKSFTTHAFHPTDRIVAAGDVTGRILIWRGFGNRAFSKSDQSIKTNSTYNEGGRPGVRGDDDADSCTTWHWHPAEVNVLSFSSDGAYLYSGKENLPDQLELKTALQFALVYHISFSSWFLLIWPCIKYTVNDELFLIL